MSRTKTNEIDNVELRESLTKTAIMTLDIGKQAEMAGHTTEFGYLYDIEGVGIEALFKIVTGRQTHYVSIQRSAILRLNLNEASFRNAVKAFKELHS